MIVKTDLTKIKGVGPRVFKVLVNSKLYNEYDILNFFPKKYINNKELKFDDFIHLENVCFKALVLSKQEFFYNKYLIKYNLKIEDKYFITGLRFSAVKLFDNININQIVFICGKYNRYKNEISITSISTQKNPPVIKPIYDIKNITNYSFSNIVKNILKTKIKYEENIFSYLIDKYKIIPINKMYEYIHIPKDQQQLDSALRRLKFIEALNIEINLFKDFKNRKKDIINYDINLVKKLISDIEYDLTDDQKNAVNEIFKGYSKNTSYNYLLLGDVGSGKTVVSLIAALGAISANFQVAVMAPTQILANQHYIYFKDKLSKLGYNVQLLTSVNKDKNILKNIENGSINLVCGTTSLISDDINFKNLGLAIIDEQHRFGVENRKSLISKIKNGDVLMLSATPIPQTLAHSIFADIKLIEIKEKPKGRLPIKNHYLNNNDFDKLIPIISDTIKKDEKVFIILPAITSNKKLNIEIIYKKLSNIFYNITVIHGNMKKEDINNNILDFYNKKSNILISTSMVEVGIDVSNATLMLVLDSKYFGLSQLHQLRGRIGRNNIQSNFYILADKTDIERLKILENTNSGFELSKYDLKDRGPGNFLGIKQAGILKSKYLDFNKDYNILITAKKEAIKILENKNNLSFNDKLLLDEIISKDIDI